MIGTLHCLRESVEMANRHLPYKTDLLFPVSAQSLLVDLYVTVLLWLFNYSLVTLWYITLIGFVTSPQFHLHILRWVQLTPFSYLMLTVHFHRYFTFNATVPFTCTESTYFHTFLLLVSNFLFFDLTFVMHLVGRVLHSLCPTFLLLVSNFLLSCHSKVFGIYLFSCWILIFCCYWLSDPHLYWFFWLLFIGFNNPLVFITWYLFIGLP